MRQIEVITAIILLWVCNTQSMPDLGYTLNTNCPCDNPKWCDPVTAVGRKEQFAFSTKNDMNHWTFYDYPKLTTIATADYINISLTCFAHQLNTRVIYMAQVDEKTFLDAGLRKQWIDKHVDLVRTNYLDGLNFDYEGAIGANETTKRDAYTALIKETNQRLKQEFPYSIVAVDIAWRPGQDDRYYDYAGLAENSDFLVLMAYDEQSQIYGECVAGPNCPLNPTTEGVKQFLNYPGHPISRDKIVLAVPWFGISYECLKTDNGACYIEKIPYRGAPCSDSPGQPYDIKDIEHMKQNMPDSYKWNASSSTPYLMYKNNSTGKTYQVQYDDLRSLKLKYNIVTSMNLRGVGIFTIDMLNYSVGHEANKERLAMFQALPITKVVEEEEMNLVPQPALTQRPPCPCNDTKLCDPITATYKNEIVAFSVHNDPTHWRLFDWNKLTTIVMFNYVSTDLVCLAHAHGVRVVSVGRPSKKVIFSSTLRSQWVSQQMETVYNNYLDGINFDFEDQCSPKQKYLKKSYTALVQETSDRFRKLMPHTQISVDTIDFAYSTYRAYDYQGLAKASDYFFIMAYDMSVGGRVGPNSGYHAAKWSIQTFLRAKIPANKLVLGLPWYGDVYQCSHMQGDTCIQSTGMSVRPGLTWVSQVCYCGIMGTLNNIPDHLRWNSSSDTPYFNYQQGSKMFQVQFDDPKSLQMKYALASQAGIRGVGIWHIDCLDFSLNEYAQKMREDMFGPLPNRDGQSEELSSFNALDETPQRMYEKSKENLVVPMDIE